MASRNGIRLIIPMSSGIYRTVDADHSEGSYEDLVLLHELSSDSIAKALEKRFKGDQIYSKIGNVLISVNPFKNINDLYHSEYIPLFQNRFMYEVQPHIFSLSEDTYRSLVRQGCDQCIIVTGESGSGKTEASKKIMQYIAAVSGNSKQIVKVKEQLLKSNPVLEAFGNAKTLRNDNSSRFGKYLEIFFDRAGDPIGGKIRNFLLEKNRVTNAAKGERNFHIFYQLTRGCAGSLRDSYELKEPEFFKYLSQTGMFNLGKSSSEDVDGWKETCDGLDALGITTNTQNDIFSVLSGILWIGQLSFEGDSDKAKLSKGSDEIVDRVAKLLGADKEKLKQCFTERQSHGLGRESIVRFLNPTEAEQTRDALAKVIYHRLFDWLVEQINIAIRPKVIRISSIGVLDIYGFEIFENNSFEQFCINYVNEKLQQVFIERTLKMEQEEYRNEGIEWVPINFFNNEIVCQLIEQNRSGILSILDETCILPRGSDQIFQENIVNRLKSHAHFTPPSVKTSKTSFIIKHYAGDVEYECGGFVEKNKDLVWNDLFEIGETSSKTLMTSLFPIRNIAHIGNKRPETAGSAFKVQVNDLMKTLTDCVPHYIRCIKPNDSKTNSFDHARVEHQVRYLGLLENIKVCRAGFAFRNPFKMFLQRYKPCCPQTWPEFRGTIPDGCAAILEHLGFKNKVDFQIGKTKIFIKDPQTLFELEKELDMVLIRIFSEIQGLWKGYREREKYQLYISARKIQAPVRGFLKRKWYRSQIASIAVQKLARGYLARKRQVLDKAGFVLSTVVRSYLDTNASIKKLMIMRERIWTQKKARRVSLCTFPVSFYVPLLCENGFEVLEDTLKKQRKKDSTPFVFVDVGEKFGKKDFVVRKNRVFAITKQALYEIEWKNAEKFTRAEMLKKKCPSPQLKFHRCFLLTEVKSLSLSTKEDNFVVLHTSNSEGDYVFMMEHKTEFIVSLMIHTTGFSKFKTNFTDEILYKYKKKPALLQFVDGPGKGIQMTPLTKSKTPLCTISVGNSSK